jgi:ABC-type multidrug transport system fused ATPase/permease subunit
MSIHEEEVLGKAYDARLMRRLLEYLRPYWRQVLIALAAIVSSSVLQLAQPYLMKVAIDDYIAVGNIQGLEMLAAVYVAVRRSTGTCNASTCSTTTAIR